ncbi:CCR4-not transcription, putative [Babesia ovata]|uniref:CCR4-not transcription, putative n=1 Tax=Babesia ovata TaxID=189622 RepID=A0A2H6KAM0_9APIC|nr:CCR4-not transcription, putative [Babesia ovata]GBE60038.1 CCR4-not transcription, putative [Babesia ovata]
MVAAAHTPASRTSVLQYLEEAENMTEEERVNKYFYNLYVANVSTDEMIEVMQRFDACPSTSRNKETYRTMLAILFNECRFFPKYPVQELAITAELFGKMIKEGLLTSNGNLLMLALRCILEALRRGKSSKMFQFGSIALSQFETAIANYPWFARQLLDIPDVRETFPQLYKTCEKLQTIMSDSMLTTTYVDQARGIILRPEDCLGPPILDAPDTELPKLGLLPSMADKDRLDVGEMETLMNGVTEEFTVTAPPGPVVSLIYAAFNNMAADSAAQKAREVNEVISPENLSWLLIYIIKTRASKEQNLHEVFVIFIENVKIPKIFDMAIQITYACISACLKNIVEFKEIPSYRTLLRNLGSWIGRITVGRNMPIMSRHLDIKQIVYHAYENGAMIAALPFVCKIMEHIKHSKIFKPPNPWTTAILNFLVEIHRLKALKTSLVFEVEVLFKHLDLGMSAFANKTRLLESKVRPENSPDFDTSIIDKVEKVEPPLQTSETSSRKPKCPPLSSGTHTAAFTKTAQQAMQHALLSSMPPRQQPPRSGGAHASAPSIVPRTGPAPSADLHLLRSTPLPQHGGVTHKDSVRDKLSMLLSKVMREGPASMRALMPQLDPRRSDVPPSYANPPPDNSNAGVRPGTSVPANMHMQQAQATPTNNQANNENNVTMQLSNYAERLLQKLHGAVIISPSIAIFEIQPQLRACVPVAIERAIRRVLPIVSEHSISIARSTTRVLVANDYAGEDDETALRGAIHTMMECFATSLVRATCKEPLRIAFHESLRAALQTYRTQDCNDQVLVEQLVQIISQDNLLPAVGIAEKIVGELALREADLLVPEIAKLCKSLPKIAITLPPLLQQWNKLNVFVDKRNLTLYRSLFQRPNRQVASQQHNQSQSAPQQKNQHKQQQAHGQSGQQQKHQQSGQQGQQQAHGQSGPQQKQNQQQSHRGQQQQQQNQQQSVQGQQTHRGQQQQLGQGQQQTHRGQQQQHNQQQQNQQQQPRQQQNQQQHQQPSQQTTPQQNMPPSNHHQRQQMQQQQQPQPPSQPPQRQTKQQTPQNPPPAAAPASLPPSARPPPATPITIPAMPSNGILARFEEAFGDVRGPLRDIALFPPILYTQTPFEPGYEPIIFSTHALLVLYSLPVDHEIFTCISQCLNVMQNSKDMEMASLAISHRLIVFLCEGIGSQAGLNVEVLLCVLDGLARLNVSVKQAISSIIYAQPLERGNTVFNVVTVTGLLRYDLLDWMHLTHYLILAMDKGKNVYAFEMAIVITAIAVVDQRSITPERATGIIREIVNIKCGQEMCENYNGILLKDARAKLLKDYMELHQQNKTVVSSLTPIIKRNLCACVPAATYNIVCPDNDIEPVPEVLLRETRIINLGFGGVRRVSPPPIVSDSHRAIVSIIFAKWIECCMPYEGDNLLVAWRQFFQRFNLQSLFKMDGGTDNFFAICVGSAVGHIPSNTATYTSPQLADDDFPHEKADSLVALAKMADVMQKLVGGSDVPPSSALQKLLTSTASLIIYGDQYMGYYKLWVVMMNYFDRIESVTGQIVCRIAFLYSLKMISPLRAPEFAYFWIRLLGHRSLLPGSMAVPRCWEHVAQLFLHATCFMQSINVMEHMPHLEQVYFELIYRMCRDYPQFVVEYYFCLGGSPRIERLVGCCSMDPESAGFGTMKAPVDHIPGMTYTPRVESLIVTILYRHEIKQQVDILLRVMAHKNRLPSTPPVNIYGADFDQLLEVLEDVVVSDAGQAPTLLMALTYYVGIEFPHVMSGQITIDDTRLYLFLDLIRSFSMQGKYLFINAICRHLRFPNAHTHFFSCLVLWMYDELREPEDAEARDVMLRVLLEHVLAPTLCTWGVKLTVVELFSNPRFQLSGTTFQSLPDPLQSILDSVARARPSGRSGGILAELFRYRVETSTKKVYYYNRASKESRWQRPDVDVPESPKDATAPAPEPEEPAPKSSSEQDIAGFKALIRELKLPSSATFDSALPKMLYDTRFTAIPNHQRRSLFMQLRLELVKESSRSLKELSKEYIAKERSTTPASAAGSEQGSKEVQQEKKPGIDEFNTSNQSDKKRSGSITYQKERESNKRRHTEHAQSREQLATDMARTAFISMLHEKIKMPFYNGKPEPLDESLIEGDPRGESRHLKDRDRIYRQFVDDFLEARIALFEQKLQALGNEHIETPLDDVVHTLGERLFGHLPRERLEASLRRWRREAAELLDAFEVLLRQTLCYAEGTTDTKLRLAKLQLQADPRYQRLDCIPDERDKLVLKRIRELDEIHRKSRADLLD